MVTLTVLKVFFAGPHDVNDERSAFREVAEEQDRRGAVNLGFKLQPCGCEDTMPGYGRPQEIIDEDVDQCNLFVLSLYMRWGMPTGQYSSGVEEEFERALKRRTETGQPEIWLFFRDIAQDRLGDAGPQLEKVLAFRARIERERLLLYQPYRHPLHWRAMFGDLLTDWLFATARRGGPGPGDRLPLSEALAGVAEASEYITSTVDLQAEVERLRGQVATAETKLRKAALETLIHANELEKEGRTTEAEAAFVRGLDLFEIPEGRNAFGVFLARAERFREAVSQFERAHQLEPDHVHLYNWGTALAELAKSLWEAGEREEARRLYEEGFERYREAVAVKPDYHEALYNWGNDLTDLADALWHAGEREEARRLYEEGFERYREAVAVKPDRHEALYNWGIALTDLAKSVWEAGEREEARRLYEEGFARYRDAVAVKPDMHEALNNWGSGLTDLARALWQVEEREEARRLYEEGFQRYGEALAVKPDKHEALYNWGTALMHLAGALWEAGERAESRRLYEQGFERYREAVAVKPDMPDALYNWGNGFTDLARALWQVEEREEARRLYEEGFQRYGEALAVKPDKHEALYNWGNALTGLAKGLWEAGEREEARRLYEEGFQRYGEAVAVKPDKHEALYNWGTALTDLAKALSELGEGEEARRLYEEGFQRYREALAVKPDKQGALHNWGVTLREYAPLAPPRRRGAIVREANRKLRQAKAMAEADP